MRIGIVPPVLVQHPATRADWEQGAGIAEVSTIAETADRLGYHHITCSEHVAIPVDVATERGGTYWDPLSTLGFLAARTRRIRLATQVLVLGYHHPLEIAKRYGTLDQLSKGRVILGLGVGSLREEFELIGAQFEGRGSLADDAIGALRASMSQAVPSYHGEHYSFDGFVVEPHAAQSRVPLWIGGHTHRSLRRAVQHGDGWVPFGLSMDELAAMIGKTEVPDALDIVLNPGRPLDPLDFPDKTRRGLERAQDAGATLLGVNIRADSAGQYCEQLAALREVGIGTGVEFGRTEMEDPR